MAGDGGFLSGRVVGISISDSPDLARYGLGTVHLRHAFVEVARQLLAAGASLAYGGDLRENGYLDLLLDLLRTYQQADRPDPARVRSYLAGPIHDRLGDDDRARLKVLATVTPTAAAPPRDDVAAEVRDHVRFADSLTLMRKEMTAALDARVVLGGPVAGFKGRWPGVAEEALLALRAGKPLYLLGGFGGCGRALADLVAGAAAEDLTVERFGAADPGYGILLPFLGVTDDHLRRPFAAGGVAALRNGLDQAENERLRLSADIDELCALLLRGLRA